MNSSVTELKARLSHYLRAVKRGSRVQILERGRPIAQLAPIESDADDESRHERLVEAGLVAAAAASAAEVLSEKPIRLPSSLQDDLHRERRDRF